VSEARAAAIDELFASLDALMAFYRSLPEDEARERMGADAVLITGEVVRRLAVARAQVAAGAAPLDRVS
jgi:hypothetical protein